VGSRTGKRELTVGLAHTTRRLDLPRRAV